MKTKLYLSIAACVYGMIGCKGVDKSGSDVNQSVFEAGSISYTIKGEAWAFLSKEAIEGQKGGVLLKGAEIVMKDKLNRKPCSKAINKDVEVVKVKINSFSEEDAYCYVVKDDKGSTDEYWILESRVEVLRDTRTVGCDGNGNCRRL